MAMKKYRFAITQIVEIEIDEDNFGPDFLAEFSTTMWTVHDPKEVAQHIAFNFGFNGAYDFVEGVGDLEEMGVNVSSIEVDVEPVDWAEAA